MKTLFILRHAKSSWDNARLADHDRLLNERGKVDAPRMGRLLRDKSLTPDLIISSSAERALATAEAVAVAGNYEDELVVTRSLYHANPEAYLEILRELAESYERVMVVGHNPGVEELLEMLTGRGEYLPTAALAHIRLPLKVWSELSDQTEGKLIDLWLPRELT